MAAPPIAIWERENLDEQAIVQNLERYLKLLERNRPALISTIRVSDLWPYLRQLGVVDARLQAELQMKGPPHEQVAALLDFLLKNPTWRMHAVFKGLCMTNQGHVISEILGLDPEVYQQEQGVSGQRRSTQSHTDCTERKGTEEQLSPELREALNGHRDFYSRMLMKGHLFDIKELDLPYDMKNCYIQIVASSDEIFREPVEIIPDKLLSVEPGKAALKTALLSGPPGAGKSTFIRHYAYKGSKPSGKEGEERNEWDLIVILDVSTLKLTSQKSAEDHVMEAIRQSLAGPDAEVIMKGLNDKVLKVLIIPDGLDECRSSTTLEMLTELVNSTYQGKFEFTVLATCRSGLCPIKESYFDRRMKIEGFTTEQGVEYVRRFYSEIQKPSDDSIFMYIANSKGKLDHILTNPLRTHILSIVTADGTLKLKEGQSLGLKELLQSMEESMKRRQLEKEGELEKVGEDSVDFDLEEQTQRFYKMSLYALLKDIRDFGKHLFQKFGIHPRNPYFTFMKTHSTYNEKFKKVSKWHFSHEMFFEYFATCALEQMPDDTLKHFLLLICSRKQFRNTQRILFSALGEDPEQAGILSDMVKATLILQCEERFGKKSEEQISDIQEKVKSLMTAETQLKILVQDRKNEAKTDPANGTLENACVLWDEIKHMYEDDAEKPVKHNIFSCMLENMGLMRHLYSCLREVPTQLQSQVFAVSVALILPDRCDVRKRNTVYATGGTRWAAIRGASFPDEICSWDLSDACQALKQYDLSNNHKRERLNLPDTGLNNQQIHEDPLEHPAKTSMKQYNQMFSIFSFDISLQSRKSLHMPPELWKVWGEPPSEDLLSVQNWSQLFHDIGHKWQFRAYWLNVWWVEDYHISIKGLLDALLQEDTQHDLKQFLVEWGGQRDVRVKYGHIDSEDLCDWTRRYTNQNALRIELSDLTCHITPDDGHNIDSQLKKVLDIQHIKHVGHPLFTNLSMVARRPFDAHETQLIETKTDHEDDGASTSWQDDEPRTKRLRASFDI